ncbi:MAG: molecular chaperone DnaJ, partial [Clostridia bacterium]|nr:molecular chaperone DnaJ [Clostridia bacterium]
VTLSFEEAAFGVKKEITFQRLETCADCSGSGAKKGTKAETCSVCHGTGSVNVVRNTGFMRMQTQRECSACGGTGKIIKEKCSACSGNGFLRKRKTLEVNIPAGIDEGERVSVSGQGNCGRNGGPYGDLIIVVNIRPHPIFERRGTNIYCEVPITFVEAALGANIIVPTLEGKAEIKIPEGTQTGSVFSLKEKGIPGIRNKTRGTLFVTVNIEVPRNLTSAQKEALQKFGDACDNKNYAKKQSFFEKLNDKFKKK